MCFIDFKTNIYSAPPIQENDCSKKHCQIGGGIKPLSMNDDQSFSDKAERQTLKVEYFGTAFIMFDSGYRAMSRTQEHPKEMTTCKEEG